MTLHMCHSANIRTGGCDQMARALGSVARAGYAAGAHVVGCQCPFSFEGSMAALETLYGNLLHKEKRRRRSLRQAMQAAVAALYQSPPHNYYDWADLVFMEQESTTPAP